MSERSLSRWLEYIEQLHPQDIELGLERVRAVQTAMQLDRFPATIIVVGGTNGKGSVVSLLESIYAAAGYRIGCYTSPHLVSYNERVRVDGRNVDDRALCEAFDHVERARDDIALTYFEFGTLAAMDVFRSRQAELVILEVGLGGRLDAVNVFDGDVAVVTSIGIDHGEWLGHDRESIAREKAGVFRPGRPAICGEANPPITLVEAARETRANLMCRQKDFSLDCGAEQCRFSGPVRQWQSLPPPGLAGRHQRGNAACALAVVDCLMSRVPVTRQAVATGMVSASLAGRFQEVRQNPSVVLDVAHNADATAALADTCQIRSVDGRTLAVVGMMQDKAIDASLAAMLDIVDEWYLASLPPPRGANADILYGVLDALGRGHRCQVYDDMESAYRKAITAAQPQDRILVFGSFISVGAIMRQLV